MSKTLEQLRRGIATTMQMPFYKRYASYLTAGSGSSTSKVVNSKLAQADKFWNGAWFYNRDTSEHSLIRSFDNAGNSFMLEVPCLATTEGADFEILSGWSALEVHEAINRVLEESGRTFPDTVNDSTIILQEDKLEYSLASLARVPWIVTQLFIERRGNVKRGVAVSATSTTLVVESTDVLTGVDTSYSVSIYAGKGAGQLRSVVSVSGAEITVAAWTTTPDSTSKYALWDTAQELVDNIPLDSYRLNKKEDPTSFTLGRRMESLYGMRITVQYLSLPVSLSADADTTDVPPGYIIPAACAFLYGQKISSTKADKEVYMAEFERLSKMAEKYAVTNRPSKPDVHLRRYRNGDSIQDSSNPLGW